MAEPVPDSPNSSATKRCAIVTGANKGIGLEICRQLASKGVLVVLTARDNRRGFEALENLKVSGPSADNVCFHQLDVRDSASVASLANFLKTRFGKLDILVNNAGIRSGTIDNDVFRTQKLPDQFEERMQILLKYVRENYELAEECLETNYYGTKRVTEALLPLLQLSTSPVIVNVSSAAELLQNVSNERAKEILSNIDESTEVKVNDLLHEYLHDFKEGLLQPKGWPATMSAYIVSKAAVNTYTRVLANKFPSFRINCVCPGSVKTDISYNTGILSVEEGAEKIVSLALLQNDTPSGLFFIDKKVSPF